MNKSSNTPAKPGILDKLKQAGAKSAAVSAIQASFADLKQSASKVAKAVAVMRQRVAVIDEEIAVRRAELDQLGKQLVPPEDLATFFSDYVEVMAEEGKREVLKGLFAIIHLNETGGGAQSSQPPQTPMNFADLEGWLNKEKTQRAAGWLNTLPLIQRCPRGFIDQNVFAFLFKDRIKAALYDLAREQPIQYWNAKNLTIGIGFKERRERITALHHEIGDLEAEREDIVSRLADLGVRDLNAGSVR